MYSKKIIDIWEGEVRVFFNFYERGRKFTLGFPKKFMPVDDVYIKIDDKEQPRISIIEARGYLTQGMISLLAPRVKGLSSPNQPHPKSIEGIKSKLGAHHHTGYCQRCGKKLQGNKDKALCYACWKDQ